MTDLFDVLADTTRRDILQLLRDRQRDAVPPSDPDGQPGEWSVGELVEALGTTQPTVSKHLKVLRDAALVSVRDVGQRRFYRLESSPLQEIDRWVESVGGAGAGGPQRESGSTPWVDLTGFGVRLGVLVGRSTRAVVSLITTGASSLYRTRSTGLQ